MSEIEVQLAIFPTEKDIPVGLTDCDVELAWLQCELQDATSPEQIQGMQEALALAKACALGGQDLAPSAIKELVLQLGKLIEPQKGRGWRSTAVTFRSGDVGEGPENIERAIDSWAEAFAEGRLDPSEAYYYFEKIHPFADGNGRVGHCLWALAVTRQTGAWPETLPPDVFGQEYARQPMSAFGNIEE